MGTGQGSYQKVSSMEMVGAGRGDFEKEKVVVSQGVKVRTGMLAALGLLVLGLAALGAYLWWPRQAADVPLAAPVVTPAPKEVRKVDKPPGDDPEPEAVYDLCYIYII